jgi:hypothetical protein
LMDTFTWMLLMQSFTCTVQCPRLSSSYAQRVYPLMGCTEGVDVNIYVYTYIGIFFIDIFIVYLPVTITH